MFEVISTVTASLDTGMPIAADIMNCPVLYLDYYSIIKEELTAISEL